MSFERDVFTITPSANEGGVISPDTKAWLFYGTDSATYTLTPDPGFHIKELVIDGTSIPATDTYKFTNVTGAHTIHAVFEPDPRIIVPSAGAHGSISPDTTQTVPYGSDATFTFTPDVGYHIASLKIDGVTVPNAKTYTFRNVVDNHTIAVTFAIDTFAITPSAGANGAIAPSTVARVNYGADSATYTLTPSPGYYVSQLVVDGVNKGSIKTYKFKNVKANHTISGTFALKTIVRYKGNPYQNALFTAKLVYPKWAGVRHVVITSGDSRDLFEAATAPGLSGAYNAPLLLNPRSGLRKDVRSALIAMPNGLKVHIVGKGINSATKRQLQKVPGVSSVDRVYGADSYTTAASVARRMKSVLGSQFPTATLIAAASANKRVPDSAVGAVVSARKHFPLLYVKTTSVPSVTTKALADLGLTKRYILGERLAVNQAVQTKLGVPEIDRIGGVTWDYTAGRFAARAKLEKWLPSTRVGFAAEASQAVWTGSFLASRGAPLLGVTKTTVLAPTKVYLTTNKGDIIGGYVFGPTSSVSESVRLQLLNLIK